MNFKKIILASALFSGLVYASQFVVTIDDDFKVIKGYGESITYTDWINDPNNPAFCENDKESNEFYHGVFFEQTETCYQPEKRTKTTIVVNGNGELDTIVEDEYRNLNTGSNTTNQTGTFLAKTCRGIQQFDNSLPTGFYLVNPNGNMNVYCDMDTSGGGWTVISKEAGGGINEALYTNYPVNDGNPNNSTYRMSRTNMNTMKALSTEMRLDCRGSDHLEMSSSNLFNGEGGPNSCDNNTNVLYTSASLKGYSVKNKVICTWNTGIGSGVGKGCAGAFHIDETAQEAYYGCNLSNYPWAGTPIVVGSADTFAIAGGTKDSSTDCHKSGAERFIMLR